MCNDPGYTSLCAAIDKAGLGETLPTGSWTLFAPNDAAFAEFLDEFGLTFDTVPVDFLTELLLMHVVETEYTLTDLANSCSDLLEMASGEETRTRCDDTDNIYQKGAGNTREESPMVIVANVKTCNGIVHAIDEVIAPFSLRDSADGSGDDLDGEDLDGDDSDGDDWDGDDSDGDDSDGDDSDGDDSDGDDSDGDDSDGDDSDGDDSDNDNNDDGDDFDSDNSDDGDDVDDEED